MGSLKEKHSRLLLRSILYPVGSARPANADALVSHLKKVFGFKDQLVQDMKQCSHEQAVEVEVEVVEGKDLKAMDTNGLSDPYCTLALLGTQDVDSNGDIKVNRRSFSHGSVCRTTVKPKTLTPVWNESFTLDVDDVNKQMLLVCVWDHDEGTTLWDSVKSVDRPRALISLFRQVKQTIGHGKNMDDFIGVTAIPLKDIASEGTDDWFEVRSKLGKHSRSTGKLRLCLGLARKQNAERCDSVESERCTLDDFYKVVQELHHHAAAERPDEAYDGQLPPESEVAVRIFALQNHLGQHTQDLIKFLVFLEWCTEASQPASTDTLAAKALDQLQKTIVRSSAWELVNNSGTDSLHASVFTVYELALLNNIVTSYLEHYLNRRQECVGILFPVTSDTVPSILDRFRPIDKLLSLEFDSWTPEYKKKMVEYLIAKVQTDFDSWMEEQLNAMSGEERDSVLQYVDSLSLLVSDVWNHCSSLGDINSRLPYTKWGFDYLRSVALAVDNKVAPLCQQAMIQFDQYQERYKRFHVNIRNSSGISHSFYRNVKKVTSGLQAMANSSDATVQTQLLLSAHHKWFSRSFMYMLHTYRDECYLRVSRAVDLDTMMSTYTGTDTSNISSSAIHVVTCFSQILTEWKTLEVEDKDFYVASLVRLTDVICDATKLFAEKMEKRTLKFCGNQQCSTFIASALVCRPLNNMDHVWKYVQGLPSVMSWNEKDADLPVEILSRVLHSAEEDVDGIKNYILQCFADCMKEQLSKRLDGWLQCNTGRTALSEKLSKDADKVLGYLDKNLRIFNDYLPSETFTKLLEIMWAFVLYHIETSFHPGLRPEYAKTVRQNLTSVADYFKSLELDEQHFKTQQLNYVMEMLRIHGMTSTELQLEYYSTLAKTMDTPVDYLGHLAFRAGFKRMSKRNVTITIQVINAEQLPGTGRSGGASPYVVVELCPEPIFPAVQPQQTPVHHKTLNPAFNATFDFSNLPESVLSIRGAVLHLTVLDQDTFHSPELAGENFLNLSSLQDMSKFATIEFLPARMMPLKTFGTSHPIFTVLQQRASWDKQAKSFLKKRHGLSRTESQPLAVTHKKTFCGLFPL